jgi:lipopolysaccharide transport system permease protein
MSGARMFRLLSMSSHATAPDLVIEPGRIERNYWQDLWRFRELFYILSWRDLRVRYKQTVIGVAWAVIRPLLTMVIFTVIFGYLARFKATEGAPYPIVVLAGMIPWQFVSTALAEASGSLIGNSNLLTKVYFPRIIIPVSSIIVSLIDAAISLGLLLLMMAGFRFAPRPQILLLPLFCLPAFCLACGVGLFATALNVKYRDFRYVIPFVVQIGAYVAPVGYTSAVIAQRYSERARFWYSLNPTVGIIDGFRWCITGDRLYRPGLLMSVGLSVLCLWLGVRYFRRTEKSFADNI